MNTVREGATISYSYPLSRIPHLASRIPHLASRIPHPASRISHPALAKLALIACLAAGAGQADDALSESTTRHWSLVPITKAVPPAVGNKSWPANDIDRFVLSQLEQAGLDTSSPTDRYALIRRATFDLTGLPPTAEEVTDFLGAESPEAYAQLIDRLLDSPRYGERWGRYWLDVARYADTRGHTFDSREKKFPYSYTYRDYVIRAFNDDLPYDRFILEQLAADRLVAENGPDRPSLAALGFLTLGRRFLMNEQDTIDDRIDVVTRGLMGLTVSCARCHDHKFDPIPTEDYYSLYGVFASCLEPELNPLLGEPEETEPYLAYQAEYEKRRKERDDYVREKHEELLAELRTSVGDYLVRLVKDLNEGQKLVKADATVLVAPDDVRAPVVARWKAYLDSTAAADDPIFRPWHSLARLRPEQFVDSAQEVLTDLGKPSQFGRTNPLVLQLLSRRGTRSMEHVAQLYGELLSQIEQKWQRLRSDIPSATQLPDQDEEALRQVLYGPGTPTALISKESVPLLHHGHIVRIRQLTGAMESWETTEGAPPRATVLLDAPTPIEPVVFERGNPLTPGKKVPRRFLSMLSSGANAPFTSGSGRLELAQAIASEENPLTARVLVNWVWLHHFGTGLVTTPDNFGELGMRPSHPELLDYLAATFIEAGWSIKKLHREIMTSATYQQESFRVRSAECGVQNEEELIPQSAFRNLQSIDPENRLLWRMNRRRLDFEALRDAMIAVTGRMDFSIGGKPVELLGRPFSTRRTVYAFLDREDLPAVMRAFDFPAPESTNHQRSKTTVPQQALFLMNSPFVIEQAQHLADRAASQAESATERIKALFRFVYAIEPTPEEITVALEFVENWEDHGRESTGDSEPSPDILTVWEDLAQVLLLSNRFMFVD